MLQFHPPENLKNIFSIPLDLTSWEHSTYHNTNQGDTPTRERATYSTVSNALNYLPNQKNDLPEYGLYILAFEIPEPHIYIGISTQDAAANIADRIKRHRVKATGSHVGNTSATTGGVHHPENWKIFACSRYAQMLRLNTPDDLSDTRILIAEISSEIPGIDLNTYEKYIMNNQNGVLDDICDKLWPKRNSDVIIINKITKYNGSTKLPISLFNNEDSIANTDDSINNQSGLENCNTQNQDDRNSETSESQPNNTITSNNNNRLCQCSSTDQLINFEKILINSLGDLPKELS
ncbi:hypothetical protein [Limnohabitans sp. Jir72]|uniref:hypothetical protein n=1 Tax=Limnohabitans sp. Jir72 TaxID=1977909 RepID=UPI0011B2477B|nr:hypothetical protein [Limnohabitans sp. Jir72]